MKKILKYLRYRLLCHMRKMVARAFLKETNPKIAQNYWDEMELLDSHIAKYKSYPKKNGKYRWEL